jgi:hypothetical protein
MGRFADTLDFDRTSIDGTPFSVGEAVPRIEATLAAYPVEPFFGSAVNREAALLAEAFARQRSAQRPRVVQRGAWTATTATLQTRRRVTLGARTSLQLSVYRRGFNPFRSVQGAEVPSTRFLSMFARPVLRRLASRGETDIPASMARLLT